MRPHGAAPSRDRRRVPTSTLHAVDSTGMSACGLGPMEVLGTRWPPGMSDDWCHACDVAVKSLG
jgi:hypothetical protein